MNMEKESENKTTATPVGEAVKPKGKGKECPGFLEQYVRSYPKERVFHTASDGMVFLEKDLNLAMLHQNQIAPEAKVITYKVK